MIMDTGNETATQMTEMMKNIAVDPNVEQHLDTMVIEHMLTNFSKDKILITEKNY